MLRPSVQAHLQAVQERYVLSVKALRARHEARAIEVAADLLENATSEATKVKMVEFFAGEPKPGSAVNVQVNVDRGGYEFIPKGSRLVDITPHTDAPSGDDDWQEADIVDE